jgi:phage shock protein E
MNGLISAQEVHTYLYKNEEITPMVIDVRAPEAYARGHLPGAVNIPMHQLPGKIHTLGNNRPIITYCNMDQPGSSRSENAAEMLRDAGLHARVLAGGYPEWEEAGHPIDSEQDYLPNTPPAQPRRK